jgi:hypothetical protein
MSILAARCADDHLRRMLYRVVVALLSLVWSVAAMGGETPGLPVPSPPVLSPPIRPIPAPVPVVPLPGPGGGLTPGEQSSLESQRLEVQRRLSQQERRVPMGAGDLRTLNELRAARDRLDGMLQR